MAWANFSVFAFGSLLMGVPILLHLLMKKRPRHQVFPAMRFLRQRQVANKRQMRLRNWLLLALRMAAIGLLALLFARPTVDSASMGYWLRAILLGVLAPLAIVAFVYCWLQKKSGLLRGATGLASLLLSIGLAYFLFRGLTTGNSGNLGDANDPVAAALVFDTSPRMGLVHQNKTRLEEARDMARELMKLLPSESEVAVIDSANLGAFSVDLGMAATTVDALEVTDAEFPLTELVNRGLELVGNRDDKRKEVYVFSEMSKRVWDTDAFQAIRERLKRDEDISLFVLDVGVEEPRNVQLQQLTLFSDSLAKGQPLRISTEVTSLNFEGQVDVELTLEEPDPTRPVLVDGKLLVPELTTRDRQSFQLETDGTVPISFNDLRGLTVGVHHGQVRVRSSDGLAIDDVRHFTVNVRPPFPVLLVQFDGADPQPVKQAISPDQFEREDQSAYACTIVDEKQMLNEQLTDYSVVALLDPTAMTERAWQQLEEYARGGGAVILALGQNVGDAAAFNDAAKALIPGDLKSHWRTAAGTYLFVSLSSTAHPLLSLFRGHESTIPWDESPIYKHWRLGELRPGANVVASFSNNEPFLIESAVGAGRTVVATTPLSDSKEIKRRTVWNNLPTTAVPLPFFMLTKGAFDYLARQSQQPWNHNVGQTVSLATDQAEGSDTNAAWQLVSPKGDWQNIRGADGLVTVTSSEQVGTYRLKPTNPSELGIGFSTNLPSTATDLRRLDTKELTSILGENTHTLARGTTELNRGIGRARVGRELFPFLILLVVGLLAFEHLFSNRFYSTERGKTTDVKLKAAA